jgi:4-amino-4-deoxy-L-arabinose transferase-like glycosyltransferase
MNVTTAMLVVALAAVFARWLGYTGYFGSDEVTYIAAALKPLDGNWALDDYVGANRIGINLPMTAFAALLGRNEFALALWSLLASVGEVLMVAWLAGRLAGARAALMTGLLLACLPVHVHFAGRIMGDAPLSLFITGAFVLFIEAELRRWSLGFVLAGVLAGLSFLVKPVTLFVFAILFVYPLVERRWDWRWCWMALGFLAAMVFNGLAYMALTGNFWYVFDSVRARRESGYLAQGVSGGEIESGAGIYLEFLFLKVQHTGLLGFVAAAALAGLALRSRALAALDPRARRYLVLWACGLIAILSLLPVQFKPLIFVPKQSNYMLLFVAPLCVLGGIWLASLRRAAGWLGAAAALALGLGLSLLHQASVATFTANSWATLERIGRDPAATYHVMSNAYRAASFQQLLGRGDLRPRIRSVTDASAKDATTERLFVIDTESLDWDWSRPFARLEQRPACWQEVERLQGRADGAGPTLAAVARRVALHVPGVPGSAIDRRLQRLVEPRPAIVYRAPAGCP